VTVPTVLDRLISRVRGSLTIDSKEFTGRVLPDTVVRAESQNDSGEVKHVVEIPGGLRLTSLVTRRDGSVEWRARLTNHGTTRSALLAELRPLDLLLDIAPDAVVEPTLQSAKGSQCKVDDFEPIVTTLGAGDRVHLEPTGGRSSDGVLPFFAVDLGGGELPAVAIAIGWSGQWCADIERDGDHIRISAGLACARLRLEPGESITLPTILATVGHDATSAAAVTT
jgi:alpha-galactosidase